MKSAALLLLLLFAIATVNAQTRGSGTANLGTSIGQNNTGIGQNNTGIGQNNLGISQNNTGVGPNNMGPNKTAIAISPARRLPSGPNHPSQLPQRAASTAIDGNMSGVPANAFGSWSSTSGFNSNQFTISTGVTISPEPLPPGIQFRTNVIVLSP